MRLASLLAASTIVAAPALAEDVSYSVDGEAFTGYWAKAEDPRGLVLIIHDWDGMTDYERQHLEKGLLQYCELDTFAMVLIFEAWKHWGEKV